MGAAGAHIGCFTLYCLEEGAASVLSVEPEPHNFALLQQNTHNMPVQRLQVCLCAACCQCGAVLCTVLRADCGVGGAQFARINQRQPPRAAAVRALCCVVCCAVLCAALSPSVCHCCAVLLCCVPCLQLLRQHTEPPISCWQLTITAPVRVCLDADVNLAESIQGRRQRLQGRYVCLRSA